jgi:hypothetical protein
VARRTTGLPRVTTLTRFIPVRLDPEDDRVLLASIETTFATLFAAVAALGALGAIVQARRNHRANVSDRAQERKEQRELVESEAATRREEFERESGERRRAFEEDRRARLLEQLGRISSQVAVVRETARQEADSNGSINTPIGVSIAPGEKARFFWNARRQLAADLLAYQALGGREPLAQCQELATGSTMNHLDFVVSTATSAFDELAHANKQLVPPPGPAPAA